MLSRARHRLVPKMLPLLLVLLPIAAVAQTIQPVVIDIDPDLPHDERVQLGVEANVRHSVAQLREIQARVNRPEDERALLVGAVYDIDTGEVRVLEKW